MAHFRDKWGENGFTGFCTYPKNRPDGWADPHTKACMVEDSPKQPFWRNLGVEFTSLEVLKTASHRMIKKVKHPVVALDCSPGRYPAEAKHDQIAKHLFWADPIRKEAEAFIKEHLPRPFVAVHIRQAFLESCDRGLVHSTVQCAPWVTVGSEIVPTPSSEEGEQGAEVLVQRAASYPIETCSGGGAGQMELHLIEVIKSLGGTMVTDETGAAIVPPRWEGVSVFVASDHPLVGSGPTGMSWLTEHFDAKSIEGGLSDMETGYLRPQVDLAIMDMANHMVGHCPSSFSHVSARMRLARGESVSYWGVPSSLPKKPIVHEAEAKAEL